MKSCKYFTLAAAAACALVLSACGAGAGADTSAESPPPQKLSGIIDDIGSSNDLYSIQLADSGNVWVCQGSTSPLCRLLGEGDQIKFMPTSPGSYYIYQVERTAKVGER